MSCICHVLVLVFLIHDLDLELDLSLFSFWFKKSCRLGCFHACESKAPIINLNDYSKSSQGHPRTMIVNSSSTSTLTTFTNKLITPLPLRNTKCQTQEVKCVLTNLGGFKQEHHNFFDEVECINMMQFEIEKQRHKTYKCTTKEHLQYLKFRVKNMHHTSKNMVNVLAIWASQNVTLSFNIKLKSPHR